MDETLTLKEAAAFLKLSPEALRRKAKAGEIPGAKMGKCWCFYKSDLVDCLRSRYASPRQASQSGEEAAVCHSIDERRPGGCTSPPPVDNEYAVLLGLPTKDRPRNTTTASRQPTGSMSNLVRSQSGSGKTRRNAGLRKKRTRQH
ncbi:MAG: helix-turn-helix domain-containing protein [Proteobacteria bacterium]|nr:helix-turn-helix domain-containing protein [Pseudomonadota bacterium]